MEERLFWIGLVMGGYAWATRYWTKTGKLDTRLGTALWHSFFFLLAGSAITMVVLLSMESRARFVPVAGGILSAQEVFPALLGGVLLGGWGFWSAFRQGKRSERRRHFLTDDLEWADTVFSAVILAAVLMYFVLQAFKIPSGSMENTLRVGDHLFVNKFIYGIRIPFTHKRILRFRKVHRGDIIVFRFPTEDVDESHCGSVQYGKDFIKRVMAVPGDKVEIKNGEIYINNSKVDAEPYARYDDTMRQTHFNSGISNQEYQEFWVNRQLDRKLGDTMRDNFGPIEVPGDNYFVMGDNRDHSCDGRFWGPVPDYYLKGKAWIIYWPPGRMGQAS